MKKLVIAAAVLSSFSSFGMESSSSIPDELGTYVNGWAKEFAGPFSEAEGRDWSNFSTKPFTERLQREIGDDPLALHAFKLFHAHDFVELWKYWKENKVHMLRDNVARFLDLSALAARIININESDRIYVKEIVDIVGRKNYIPYYLPRFPQFCCEMFFCLAADTDDHHDLLSRLCQNVSSDIANHQTWELNDAMLKLMIFFGSGEDIGEMDCNLDFRIMWIDDKDSTN
jgi:hypothetical protein